MTTKTVAFPRFAYLYTRSQYPARGIAAWAVLRQVYPGHWMGWLDTQRLLRKAFGISPQHVRELLYAGEGVFWKRRGTSVDLTSLDDLWLGVRDESVVDHKQIVLVPVEALRSIRATRAFLSQTVLTRGDKPVSIAYSARHMGRKKRAITAYRALLAARGILRIDRQYVRRGKMPGLVTMDTRLADPGRGEFEKGGHMWQRLPDVVTLLQGTVELRAKQRPGEEMYPRRYFRNTLELERWEECGLPTSDPLVSEINEDGLSGEWQSNVLRVDSRTENTVESRTTRRAKRSSTDRDGPTKLARFRALQWRRFRLS